MKSIRILIADDSPTARLALVGAISQTPDMIVIDEAESGVQVLSKLKSHRPDIVLMDIVMPHMDGLEATRHIMQHNPLPIVLVTSSFQSHETEIAFQAMRAGALTVLQKPTASDKRSTQQLIRTIRSMSQVAVIHHRHTAPQTPPQRRPNDVSQDWPTPRLIAIASSTGGPAALAEIFKQLPASFAIPIVVVQHISPDFVPSLVDWLQSLTSLQMKIAQEGEHPRRGIIYIAPADSHLFLNARGEFALDKIQGTFRYIPSAEVLFHSVKTVYGASAMGIVLTGMGDDGCMGLGEMTDTGALTIAQNPEEAVVDGMPNAAISQGRAQAVMTLNQIASYLASTNETEKKGLVNHEEVTRITRRR